MMTRDGADWPLTPRSADRHPEPGRRAVTPGAAFNAGWPAVSRLSVGPGPQPI